MIRARLSKGSMDAGGHHSMAQSSGAAWSTQHGGDELKQSTQLATRWPQDFTYCWQRSSEVPARVPPRAGWWHRARWPGLHTTHSLLQGAAEQETLQLPGWWGWGHGALGQARGVGDVWVSAGKGAGRVGEDPFLWHSVSSCLPHTANT